MARARSTAAVLPALLPGLLVVVLGFEAGGFYPDTWAPLALLLAVALAVRVSVAARPLAGVSARSVSPPARWRCWARGRRSPRPGRTRRGAA